MNRRRCHVFILVLLLPALVSCTQSDALDLSGMVSDFFSATSEADIASSIDQIVTANPDLDTVAEMLREGRDYPDVGTGWRVEYIEGIDGRTRPYHIYIPNGYDASVSYPVLFDLHGGVSTSPFPAESMFERRRLWEDDADQQGWILVVPHGDRYATWFTAAGSDNIHRELDFVKRHYNVDENRVFISGFSDGASGAIWQGFHDPTAWAGLIAYNGHPVVGGYGPYQSYPRNLLSRPMRATTGTNDALYPPEDVQPFYDLFADIGVDLAWVTYPVGHEMTFLNDEYPFTIDFIQQHVRDPLRSAIIWETADLEIGRCDWVQIDEIADVDNNASFPDVNVVDDSRGVVFGAALTYRLNDGYLVAGIEPGTLARVIGVQNEDRILRVDGHDVVSMEDIAAVMQTKKPGDRVEVVVERDGQELTLAGEIPALDYIYPRHRMTGSIHVIATGNEIETSVSNVARFTLFLSSEQFDLSRPIRVTVNGALVYDASADRDLRFMLQQAAEDNDRTMIYEAKIEIVVPQGG